MSSQKAEVIQITKDYYNSQDADNFYFNIWGGEDIHIGIYENDKTSIFDASRRTVMTMLSLIQNKSSESVILDIGSGYGGAARYLAKTIGCKVFCLNLSERQNQINREKNEKENLENLITVVDGNFEDLPFDDNYFDIVWSEDAILHSPNKKRVFEELHRVLKNNGEFIFTDPMQSDFCHPSNLKPVLERIHLNSMGSYSLYRQFARQLKFKELNIINLTEHLTTHYSRVREELQLKYDEITKIASPEYVDRMIKGLYHWISAGKKKYLTWGIIHFLKK